MAFGVRLVAFVAGAAVVGLALLGADMLWDFVLMLWRNVSWVTVWAAYELIKEVARVVRLLTARPRPRSCSIEDVVEYM